MCYTAGFPSHVLIVLSKRTYTSNVQNSRNSFTFSSCKVFPLYVLSFWRFRSNSFIWKLHSRLQLCRLHSRQQFTCAGFSPTLLQGGSGVPFPVLQGDAESPKIFQSRVPFSVLQRRVSFYSFSKQGFLSQFCNAGFPFTVFQSRVSFHSFAKQCFLLQFWKAGFAFTVLQSRVSFHSFANQGFLSQFWKAGFPLTVLKSRVSFHSFAKQGFLSQFCEAGFPFTVLQSRLSFRSFENQFAEQGFLLQFCKAGFPFTVLQRDAEFPSVYLRRVSSHSFTWWFKVANNLPLQGFLLTHFHGFRASFTTEGIRDDRATSAPFLSHRITMSCTVYSIFG